MKYFKLHLFKVNIFQHHLFFAAPLGATEYIITSVSHIAVPMMQADSFLFLFNFCWMCCSKYSYAIQWSFYLFMNFALIIPRLIFFVYFWGGTGKGDLVSPQLFRSWFILNHIAVGLKLFSLDYDKISWLWNNFITLVAWHYCSFRRKKYRNINKKYTVLVKI